MAAPTRSIRTGRHGLFIMEGVFALSVIAGLAFVTVRIMNMGLPDTWTQAAETALDAGKTDPPPAAPDATVPKTP